MPSIRFQGRKDRIASFWLTKCAQSNAEQVKVAPQSIFTHKGATIREPSHAGDLHLIFP
jgi:hypothetical protein